MVNKQQKNKKGVELVCPVCDKQIPNLSSHLPKTTRCVYCSAIFVTTPVSVKYKTNYYQDIKPSVFHLLFLPIEKLFYSLRVKTIQNALSRHSKESVILDYGCGSGKLVKYLITSGFKKTYGFEPSADARQLAKKNGLKTIKENITPQKYDLIMFWHSLEHTKNPSVVIKKITTYLKKNGRVLIAVPNAQSFESQITKDNWFHYSYPLHLIHFTPKSIIHLLTKYQYKKIKIDYFNPEYTLSGVIQSFLNLFFPEDVLYHSLSNRRSNQNNLEQIFYSLLSIIIVITFSPFIATLFIYLLISKKTGAILVTACRN